jgi:hypothetical protein
MEEPIATPMVSSILPLAAIQTLRAHASRPGQDLLRSKPSCGTAHLVTCSVRKRHHVSRGYVGRARGFERTCSVSHDREQDQPDKGLGNAVSLRKLVDRADEVVGAEARDDGHDDERADRRVDVHLGLLFFLLVRVLEEVVVSLELEEEVCARGQIALVEEHCTS